MLNEVAELASQIPPMASQLGQFEDNLEGFMLDSLWQVDAFKQDLVSYVSHHLKVFSFSTCSAWNDCNM